MIAALVPGPEELTCDAEHVYHLGARRLPGVSEILQAAGMIDYSAVPPAALEHAKVRGTAVHRAIHYLLDADLNEKTVDDVVRPYLTAFCRFRDEESFVPLLWERPLADPVRGYAGTPDSYGPVDGLLSVVDVKAVAVVQPATRVQLVAYRGLLRANGYEVAQRMAVQLFPDGTYTAHRYADRRDEQAWNAALSLAHWRAANGLTEGRHGDR